MQTYATKYSTVLLVLLAASFEPARAQETVEAAPISDATDYRSDKIKFSYDIAVKKVDMTSPDKTPTDACVPAFTTLRGLGTLKVDGDIWPAFKVINVPAPEKKPSALSSLFLESDAVSQTNCATGKIVKLNDVVVIKQEDISSMPPDRYGLTYGALVVPYKYHVRGSKSFSGNSSVGGYAGFRQDRSGITGIALQYIVFAGAASIPVEQTTNGQKTTQNLTGVSYGVGLLGTIKDKFHMGLVFGADRVNSDAGYQDNGKPWIAVELGYAFSN